MIFGIAFALLQDPGHDLEVMGKGGIRSRRRTRSPVSTSRRWASLAYPEFVDQHRRS